MSTDDECIMAMLQIPPNLPAPAPSVSPAEALEQLRDKILNAPAIWNWAGSTETDTQPLAEWEIELLDAEYADLDADVPCAVDGSDGPACTTPAEWVLTNGCCGLANTFCSPHRTEADQGIRVLRVLTGVQCVRCQAINPLYTWRRL